MCSNASPSSESSGTVGRAINDDIHVVVLWPPAMLKCRGATLHDRVDGAPTSPGPSFPGEMGVKVQEFIAGLWWFCL